MTGLIRTLGVAAALSSGLLCFAVLAAWGWGFRRPVTAHFDVRGVRCRATIATGRATLDNAPQVQADGVALSAWTDAMLRAQAAERFQTDWENTLLAEQRDSARPEGWVPVLTRADAELACRRREIQTLRDTRPPPPRVAWTRALPWPVPPAVALALAVPPSVFVRRRRRLARRQREGLCLACGYDCRATPERCPECGTATAGAA